MLFCYKPLAAWRHGMAVVARSSESRGYADVFLLVAGRGNASERGVCPVPRRIEVAAIKRDQRARGFEDRVRLIRHRLTAGVRKSRCQPTDRVELADQYSGRRRRGLTDLIERELGEALWTPEGLAFG